MKGSIFLKKILHVVIWTLLAYAALLTRTHDEIMPYAAAWWDLGLWNISSIGVDAVRKSSMLCRDVIPGSRRRYYSASPVCHNLCHYLLRNHLDRLKKKHVEERGPEPLRWWEMVCWRDREQVCATAALLKVFALLKQFLVVCHIKSNKVCGCCQVQ